MQRFIPHKQTSPIPGPTPPAGLLSCLIKLTKIIKMIPLSKQQLAHKKVVKSGPSRRLVVILACLLIYTQSSPFASWFYSSAGAPAGTGASVNPSEPFAIPRDAFSSPTSDAVVDRSNSSLSSGSRSFAPSQVVWLANPDGLCMSSHGFSQCGDSNAWHMKPTSELHSYTLVPYIETTASFRDASSSASSEGQCLSSSSAVTGATQVTLTQRCNSEHSASTTTWQFDHSLGRLSTYVVDHDTFTLTSHCLNAIDDDAHTLALLPCGEGSFVPLVTIRYPLKPSYDTQQRKDPPKYGELVTTGTWKCPKTGLEFPRNLRTMLGDNRDQILMGADVFTKTVYNIKFKVYDVAWYADAEGVRSDPAMVPFKGRSAAELSADPAFYEAIVTPARDYDRTLYIKLAMKLKCEMMIQGMMDDLLMKDHNKARIAEASRRHAQEVCPPGFEMILTWRHPQPSNDFKDTLEIRVDGQLLASLNNDDEARDLLLQYVVPDPVAPAAKVAFAENFPAALNRESVVAASKNNKNNGKMNKVPVDLDPDDSRVVPRVFSQTGRLLNPVIMMS